jgi:hypothetical protein
MVQEQRPVRPATPEDLHRLADLAKARGLRVFESEPHRWWCSSHSSPFRLHCVTAWSCDCAGFLNVGRCTHHSLLLAHLGWIPEIEDEVLPDFGKCPSCSAGKVEEWCAGHVIGCRPCDVCGGTGRVPDQRPQGMPAVLPVAA